MVAHFVVVVRIVRGKATARSQALARGENDPDLPSTFSSLNFKNRLDIANSQVLLIFTVNAHRFNLMRSRDKTRTLYKLSGVW